MTAKPDAVGRALLERWIFVLVLVGKEFLVPYFPAARRRIAEQGGYGPDFAPFLARTLETLTQPGWPAGSYYPGGLFRSLQARAQAPLELAPTLESMAGFATDEVRVEADGRWLVGPKQVQGNVLRHFLRHLEFDPELGRYRIRYWLEQYYETRYIHPLSPPLRVVSADLGRMVALLNDETEEPLRPETLRMDAGERLTMAVKQHGLPALYEDNARWQVLQHAEQSGDGWVLLLPSGEVPLQLHAPRPYAGDVPLAPAADGDAQAPASGERA